MYGKFFVFDGLDGTGKSTQMELLCNWLSEMGRDIIRCRDPGSSQLGEALRKIVLRGEMAIGARSETLIYMAARAQLVDEIIRPALDDGKIVVSDRYLLANVVYQAYGLGLEPAEVWNLGQFATSGVMPHITFVLDMDHRQASQRLGSDIDRLEQRDAEYHAKVRDGFLREAKQNPDSIRVINADQLIDDVQKDIRAAAMECL